MASERDLYQPPQEGLRARLYEIIFEASTPAGKAFDIALLIAILVSVLAVLLESVASLRAQYLGLFHLLEWVVTLLFTIEYALRIYCVGQPKHYIFSFLGIIDLLAILPTYLSLFLPGTQYLLVIRVLRLLRLFRIFKLVRYVQESQVLGTALYASRRKITVFILGVLSVVVIIGALMYLIEGPEHGYTSIPTSMYWAIVTLTTVGYGDISPETPLGKALACALMILGYGIIAVPTGIVTVELAQASRHAEALRCPHCGRGGHESAADYCKYCGGGLSGED